MVAKKTEPYILQTDKNIISTIEMNIRNSVINGSGDLGLIPGRVILKTFKMILDTFLLNTQQYKVRIKGKVNRKVVKSNIYNGFSCNISFFIQGRTFSSRSSSSLNKERNIIAKRIVSD